MSLFLQACTMALGVATGAVHASYVEASCHNWIQHASRELRDVYKKVPIVGKMLIRAWESHTILHHKLTFQPDYLTQFKDQDAEIRAITYALEHGHPLNERCGLTVNTLGVLKMLVPFAPGVGAAAYWTSPVFAIPFGLMALFPPLYSKFVHPNLHDNYQASIREAPLPVSTLLKSPWGRTMWVQHRMHHRYTKSNFNLFFRFGDFLNRTFRRATATDLAEIRRIGGPH